MAWELGTLGAGNHNPSFSVWLWGGGITSAQAGPSGHLGFSLLDFLPEVITASPRGIFPLTRFESDEASNQYYLSRNICNYPIPDGVAVVNEALMWLFWVWIQLRWHHRALGHLCHECLADPTEEKNMLINYLNGVDGQGLTYGPTVMDEEPKWHVAQERRSHMWWLKETSGTARERRVTQSTAN